MDKNQRDNFLKAIIRLPLTVDKITPVAVAEILAKPKLHLWVAAFSVVFLISMKMDELKKGRGVAGLHITPEDAPSY